MMISVQQVHLGVIVGTDIKKLINGNKKKKKVYLFLFFYDIIHM